MRRWSGTPARLVDDLRRELGAVCHARRAFDVELQKWGIVPEDGPPRAVWVGLRDSKGKWGELRAAVDRVLADHVLAPTLGGEEGWIVARVRPLGRTWNPAVVKAWAGSLAPPTPFAVERVALNFDHRDGRKPPAPLAEFALGGRRT